MTQASEFQSIDIPLDEGLFMRNLLNKFAGTLEKVVGIDEASGFISLVGQEIGDLLNQSYCSALGTARMDRSQLLQTLVDLKRRIGGDFRLISADAGKIILENHACNFGGKVRGHTPLCMMTSNVMGTLVAENLGYARICLEATIARGDPQCRVVINLQEPPSGVSLPGIEHFAGR